MHKVNSVMMSYMRGLNYADEFRFEGEIKAGRGHQTVGVVVPKKTILAIATALQYTNSAGHAVWHAQNPERTIPCSSCELASQQSTQPTTR